MIPEVTTAAVKLVVADEAEGHQRAKLKATSQSIRYVKETDGHLKSLLLTINIVGMCVNGQMDTGASMSMMFEDTARELDLLKEELGEESYCTASGSVEKALRRLEQVPVVIADVRIL